MSRKPVPMRVEDFRADSIPAELTEHDQWVNWDSVFRGGKLAKVPLNPRNRRPASTTDRSHWASFEEALAAWKAHPHIDGVGFVFTPEDPFAGIDLDDCRSTDGTLTPEADAIVREVSSLTEISSSGTGVKIILKGKKALEWHTKCRPPKHHHIEIYDRNRYFVVTGNVLPDFRTIESRGPELQALMRRLWLPSRQPKANPPSRVPDNDEELIELMFSARNGDRVRRLSEGDTSDYGGDDSAADLALCNHFAFWTGRDAARMDALFRRSKLFREKWDDRRGDSTYGGWTISKAIEACKDVYSARGARCGSGAASPIGTVTRPAAPGSVELPGGITIQLGDRDPASGRVVLSSTSTVPTAEAFLRDFHQHEDGSTLLSLGGEFRTWNNSCFAPTSELAIRQSIQQFLHQACRIRTRRKAPELVSFECNPAAVTGVVETLRARLHMELPGPLPRWRSPREGDVAAHELILCSNAYIHVPTARVLEPTPRLVSLTCLSVAFDRDATTPVRWMTFLGQLFGDDDESRRLLQMWFGYCLMSDSRQQKMLLIVGPRRSGKGTIGRVLKAIVGEQHVASPTTSTLQSPFGLEGLLGKSLALVEDARFGGERPKLLVEILLNISGGGRISVNCKHRKVNDVELGTKFMFLANEIPSLPDPTKALAGRFLILRLRNSFYGKEDASLGDDLVTELPGILLWAIEGLRRLRAEGRFIQPQSALESVRQLDELSAPVASFVESACILEPGARVETDALFKAWADWCDERESEPGTPQNFGKALRSLAGLPKPRQGTGGTRFYDDIRLRVEVDQ